MAAIDVSRAALRLTDEELGVSAMLLGAPDHPSLAEPSSRAAIERLTDAGIVADGALTEFAAALIGLVVAPKLRISLERFVGLSTALDQAWATETEGVTGVVTGDGLIELAPIQPQMLPWEIARWVGLGPRDRPAGGPIRVASEALGEAGAAMAELDVDRARRRLADEPDGERMAELLVKRRLSWRATSGWASGPDQQQLRSVAVLDAGTAGLWLTEQEDGVARLEPAAASDVWDRIVRLMPR